MEDYYSYILQRVKIQVNSGTGGDNTVIQNCAVRVNRINAECLVKCRALVDCCTAFHFYNHHYAKVANELCGLNRMYKSSFMQIFKNTYESIDNSESKVQVYSAQFFAYLLYTDAIDWTILSVIKFRSSEITAQKMAFLQWLFQTLKDNMGLEALNERLKDDTMVEAFDGLFRHETVDDIRIATEFFTSFGLEKLIMPEEAISLKKTNKKKKKSSPKET